LVPITGIRDISERPPDENPSSGPHLRPRDGSVSILSPIHVGYNRFEVLVWG